MPTSSVVKGDPEWEALWEKATGGKDPLGNLPDTVPYGESTYKVLRLGDDDAVFVLVSTVTVQQDTSFGR